MAALLREEPMRFTLKECYEKVWEENCYQVRSRPDFCWNLSCHPVLTETYVLRNDEESAAHQPYCYIAKSAIDKLAIQPDPYSKTSVINVMRKDESVTQIRVCKYRHHVIAGQQPQGFAGTVVLRFWLPDWNDQRVDFWWK